MEEDGGTAVSRRALVLGAGAAMVWVTPVVTRVGIPPAAASHEPDPDPVVDTPDEPVTTTAAGSGISHHGEQPADVLAIGTGAGTASGGVARTGSNDLVPLVGAGAALVGAGASLSIAARRRRRIVLGWQPDRRRLAHLLRSVRRPGSPRSQTSIAPEDERL